MEKPRLERKDKYERDLSRKLENLVNDSPWKKFSVHDNTHNMSSCLLTENKRDILRYGLSFAMKPFKKCALDMLVPCHDFLNTLPFDNRSPSLIGVLYEGFIKSVKSVDNITNRFRKNLGSLKKDQSIIVTKANRDGKVVLMDREVYHDKMLDLISDRETYKPLISNPLSRIQSTFNKGLKEITRDIDFDVNRFISRLPRLPYMYGLPKIHKPNIPLRSIISSRGAPSYVLAKWLAGILTPLLGRFSNAHVRNNMDFMDKIKNVSFSCSKMISYNVASLFTKVDPSCTLNFLSRKLSELYPTELPLPVNVVIDLIRLCVNDNVFT